jgi:hypothetical protein
MSKIVGAGSAPFRPCDVAGRYVAMTAAECSNLPRLAELRTTFGPRRKNARESTLISGSVRLPRSLSGVFHD